MRPQRLYKTAKGRYYFLIDGVRKYIRFPKGMTEAELLRLNLKTILKLYGKRVKGRKKRKMAKFEIPIISQPLKTASSAYVEEGKPISEISDITSGKERKKREALYDVLTAVALSGKKSTVAPAIEDKPKKGAIEDKPKKGAIEDKSKVSEELKFGRQEFTNLTDAERKAVTHIVDSEPSSPYESPVNMSDQPSTTRLLRPIPKVIPKVTDFQKGLFSNISAPTSTARFPSNLSNIIEESKEDTRIQESKENPTDVAQRLRDPVEVTQSKKRIKKFLRTGEGTLASEGIKPKSTEQKLAETPSFSSSTGGITEPATLPRTEFTTKGPPGAMPVSLYETAKAEYLSTLSPDEQAKAVMGFGMDDGDDGLYNDELAHLIRKRVGQIVPVLPSDKVNQLLGYVVKGDKKFAAVINTNPSQSDGSGTDSYRPGHWRAIFIDNRDDYPSCEYFDPLSEGPPEKSLVNVMKKLCKIMNPEKMCLYKQSNIRRQAKEKSTCGWHVAQFIDDRWNGDSWADASGYNHYMQSQKEAVDDSTDGEKEVSKYIKKYNRYI